MRVIFVFGTRTTWVYVSEYVTCHEGPIEVSAYCFESLRFSRVSLRYSLEEMYEKGR